MQDSFGFAPSLPPPNQKSSTLTVPAQDAPIVLKLPPVRNKSEAFLVAPVLPSLFSPIFFIRGRLYQLLRTPSLSVYRTLHDRLPMVTTLRHSDLLGLFQSLPSNSPRTLLTFPPVLEMARTIPFLQLSSLFPI